MGNSRVHSETGKDLKSNSPDPGNDEKSNDTDAHWAFTMADPIGAILMGSDINNAALGAKVGLKESNVKL
jgi:hypothetical protein